MILPGAHDDLCVLSLLACMCCVVERPIVSQSGGCQGEVCSPDELFRAFVQSLGIHGRLTPQAAAILNTTSQHLGMRMSVPIPMAAADTPNPFYEVSSNHSADSSLVRRAMLLLTRCFISCADCGCVMRTLIGELGAKEDQAFSRSRLLYDCC